MVLLLTVECSVTHGSRDNQPQESMPGWKEAHALVCNAMTLAVDTGTKEANCDEAANEKTKEALRCLQDRLDLCFFILDCRSD